MALKAPFSFYRKYFILYLYMIHPTKYIIHDIKMKTFICEICGDAYLGGEKPHSCPYCGARSAFIKEGKDANPVINQPMEISELSRKNLLETLELETRANAIYLCMADNADTYEIGTMYKRLALVELEHANIVRKFLKIELPEHREETCSSEDVENFQKTIELEEHAQDIYAKFSKEAVEQPLKIFFTALTQAEQDHIELIKNYI
ncbi:MAG TPA: ferritin [Candidatus Moranbacteria bacterium]|nr:MAG: hypothetical protein UW87_C0021G0006 [Candidatus Moranbacteria bacterium GW2011_GWC2_45_10]KKT94610.1 MAG: hypothetical protein UW95_C0012G0026 [Parcubacteria group bacterium GW2011_GWC1_45_14]HAV11595.1 ferritin [Candidatus Moranbacteria bacterium]